MEGFGSRRPCTFGRDTVDLRRSLDVNWLHRVTLRMPYFWFYARGGRLSGLF